MNTAHTPGPWHRNIRAKGRYPVIFAGRNTHVALAEQMPTSEETEANIDLIAAAPELLAALQEASWYVYKHTSLFDQKDLTTVAGRVAAAIAKTEGRK